MLRYTVGQRGAALWLLFGDVLVGDADVDRVSLRRRSCS